MDEIKDFLVGEHAEDGMGVVEVLLIIVENRRCTSLVCFV